MAASAPITSECRGIVSLSLHRGPVADAFRNRLARFIFRHRSRQHPLPLPLQQLQRCETSPTCRHAPTPPALSERSSGRQSIL